MTNRIEEMLENDGGDGFTPALNVQDQSAAWQAAQRTEPVQTEEPAAPVAAPVIAPAEADVSLLRAAGWSDADLSGLSPEAVARHALRESGRKPETERAVEASGPDDLEELLTEEFSSKTAKKLTPLLRSITERQAALERGVRDQSLAGLRESHKGQYPELARPEVERAVLSITGPNPSKDQYSRALRVLYGVRQTPEERGEARAQVSGQMTAGRRGPTPARDAESANKAAWNDFLKHGNADRAVAVRQRLGGQ